MVRFFNFKIPSFSNDNQAVNSPVPPASRTAAAAFVLTFLLNMILIILAPAAAAADVDSNEAKIIVQKAINYWRDKSSFMQAEMQIHRTDFDRTTKLSGWTEGDERSLVRFTFPSKDAGNATLSLGDEIWSYSPKTGRVIRIPPSMKSQSWMGSDFSYQDLARTDDIVDQYDHTIVGRGVKDGINIYTVNAVPKPDAPVVWGREELVIREDNIILSHKYFDQGGALVKELRTEEIAPMGGKLYPKRMRMIREATPADKAEGKIEAEWTEVIHTEVTFGQPVADSFFTVQNLQAR